MKISADTAASLGDKLAGLDLTDEEATLLTVLIGNSDDDDVQGFVTLGYTEVEWTYRSKVLSSLQTGWKVEEGETAVRPHTPSRYTEVEWTY